MTIQNTESGVQEAGAGHLATLGAATPHLDATKALHHAQPRPDGAYTLQLGDTRLLVDPSKKGEPGDIVVVWPRKQGPMVARRLARCAPYDTFHFRALGTGVVFELRCNKVCAIHALAADFERQAGEARS